MKFNQKLIELRKQKGLSQEELGYELSVTRQTISKWELGLSTPDMEKLMEISNFFNISIDDLTNENKDTNTNSTNNSSKINPEFVGANTEYIPKDEKTKQYVQEPKKHTKYLLFLPLFIPFIFVIIIFIFILFTEIIGFKNFSSLVTDISQLQINNDNSHNNNESTELSFDVRAYNSGLEARKGVQSEIGVGFLINDVISKPDEVKDVVVIYNNIEAKSTAELISLKNEFAEADYLISFEYGTEGYINKIIIQDIESNNNNDIATTTKELSLNVRAFNANIELKKGNTSGFFIRNLIDTVIKKPAEVKNVIIIYNNIEAKSESELTELKSKFPNSPGDNYSVSFEYSSEGYINKITITDIK